MTPIQKFGEGNRLAILFPGRGYNLDMPLMWYGKGLLGELGWQVWGVAYDHHQTGDDLQQLLQIEVNEVLGKAWGEFDEYLLIGKSLGTIAMQLAYQYPNFAAKGVWLTPLMQNAGVRKALLETRGGLVVYGTQDPAADLSLKSELETRHSVLEIPDADHWLEVPDIEQSLGIMANYIQTLRGFFSQK